MRRSKASTTYYWPWDEPTLAERTAKAINALGDARVRAIPAGTSSVRVQDSRRDSPLGSGRDLRKFVLMAAEDAARIFNLDSTNPTED